MNIKQLEPEKISTLVELLRWRAENQLDSRAYTFLVDGETQEIYLTYAELDRQARTIAAYLQTSGAAGNSRARYLNDRYLNEKTQSVYASRALLLYPPGLEYIAAFFGCLYAGIVPVPAYPPRANRSMSRLQAIVADSGATVAIATSSTLANIERYFAEAPDLKALHWLATDIIGVDQAKAWQEPLLTSNSLAFLQYTSGSTGTPKGVMVSHGNLLHNLGLIYRYFGHTPNSQGVIWLPLYHDMGLIGGVLQPLYGGFPVTLMSPMAFLQKPIRWLRAISDYKATTSGGPNFAYDLCLNKITPEQRETLDLSSWDLAFNGAEPIRAETLERFAATFASCGFRKEAFYPCYGMAEATLFVSGGLKTTAPTFCTVSGIDLEQNKIISASVEDERTRRLVSCGKSWLDQKIIIADPESLTLSPPGQVGEIWVSSPSVAGGYWNKPEETAQTFQATMADTGEGPFLRTGDLGFLQDGELFVTGRLKDMIIADGRNHYPQDIELTVEQSHPALKLAGAFSVDVASGERLVVVAEVERHYWSEVDALVKVIRRAIATHHDLQVYAVQLLKPGAIPKTSSGKIQRHACRNRFLANNLEVVGELKPNVRTSPSLQEKGMGSNDQKISNLQFSNPHSVWLGSFKPNLQARLRLFCFPCGGSGASLFRDWAEHLPPEIEVCPVQLPGRENRYSEPLFTELEPLIQTLAQIQAFEERPFAFFGYSMGALIGFELARELRRQNKSSPVHLFVAAYRAPQLATPLPHLTVDVSDSAVMEELRLAGGMPDWILQNERIMQKLLPTIRADMELVKTYTYSPETPLNCPIYAFGGTEDDLVSRSQLSAWREQTRSSFALQMFPGNHFFINEKRELFFEILSKQLMHIV